MKKTRESTAAARPGWRISLACRQTGPVRDIARKVQRTWQGFYVSHASRSRRLSSERRRRSRVVWTWQRTKASFKTTEFVAFLAIVAGILISAAVVKATSGHRDVFTAAQAWLYVSIVAVGYMVSRGLAKAGTRSRARDPREDLDLGR